jgi:hypothetical protein
VGGARAVELLLGLDVGTQARQPPQLVVEVLAPHGPTVGHVDRRDPHAAARRRDQACLTVGRPAVAEAGHRIVEPDAAGDGHPVPAALAVMDAGVAAGVEVERREGRVGLLGLL